MFCIAQIDTEGNLDDAYKAWFTGLANQGQDNIEVKFFRATTKLNETFSEYDHRTAETVLV